MTVYSGTVRPQGRSQSMALRGEWACVLSQPRSTPEGRGFIAVTVPPVRLEETVI